MIKKIPRFVDSIADSLAKVTGQFTETYFGKIFLLCILLGPLSFIPTTYEAWTAPNIDALRTWTWPLMTAVVTAELLSVLQRGDWRMRLSSFLWILMMLSVWLATIVR